MLRLIIVAAAAIGAILFVAFVASRVARSRRAGLSIRMQVFLALAAVVGAFAAGLGIMVMDRVQARAVRFALQSASDEAHLIANLLSGQIERGGPTLSELAAQLERDQQHGGTSPWKLSDERGGVLFHRPLSRGDGPSGELSGAGPTVSGAAPVIVRGQRVGHVEVIKPTIVMERLLTDFAPTVLVISLVLGAAAAIAAAWIGRSIAAPIEALSRFSERVSRGEQGAQPPPAPWGREVTRLTRSIDSMRRQLEGRPFAELFAADLSHELKNPVAAIRASAEVLEEGALAEPEQARRFVGRIREAVGRIERLLADLLNLARMEAGGVEELETVDLAELVQKSLDTLPSRARISVSELQQVKLRGEPVWLSRAIGNLLHNALIHSPPNSPIEISVLAHDGQGHVVVKNQGHVTRYVRDNIFRRFITTREDKGGTGLGLAIVRAVAEAHAGQAQLSDPGPPHVVFTLSLPALRGLLALSGLAQKPGSTRATTSRPEDELRD
jgi:two-component system, OmpR family, sensor histidine kinase CreC